MRTIPARAPRRGAWSRIAAGWAAVAMLALAPGLTGRPAGARGDPAERHDRPRPAGGFRLGHGDRHGQPAGERHDLLLRFRDHGQLRHADLGHLGRGGHGRRVRAAAAQRPRAEHDLPLPPRRRERGGHRPRPRCDVRHHEDAGAHVEHRRRHLGDERRGDAQRQRQPRRCPDHLLLRIRDDGRLRHQDGDAVRGVGDRGAGGVRGRHRARGEHDLPLPPRGGERRRHGGRRRRHLHDGQDRRPRGGHRKREPGEHDDGGARRHGQPRGRGHDLPLPVRDHAELRPHHGHRARRGRGPPRRS